jgi:uncharacterized iron-regulated membrane protein
MILRVIINCTYHNDSKPLRQVKVSPMDALRSDANATPATITPAPDPLRRNALRRWHWIHTWSSLICTLFLLIVCITGLPLVFSDEIDHWSTPHTYASLPADAPRASLDRLAEIGHQMYPDQVIDSFFVDDDEPQVYLWMVPSFEALKANPKVMHFIRFDARTAQVLETSKSLEEQQHTFMGVMLTLHTELFAGLPGELFLAVMALLFVIAIVSGGVLYGPFMKKIDFGTVRQGRGQRLKWLDVHNLLGISVLAWTLVVGLTGVMNELSVPLFGLWEQTDVARMLSQWKDAPDIPVSALSSPQAAYETAQRAVPGNVVTSLVYPRPLSIGESAGPSQYLLWSHGASHLRERLFDPILVNARTGTLSLAATMPWYLRALEVSRPLHFGDYGGLPLKILWAILDFITIVVLGSGLYLWIARRRTRATRWERIIAAHEATRASAGSPMRGAA